MLRSLFSVIAAVIIGLTVAKFIEGAGAAIYPPPSGVDLANPGDMKAHAGALPLGYKAVLALGWGVGAFIAAAIALALGKRWAPLGYLAAATIFLNAMIALLSQPLGLWLWPAAAAFCAAGGWLASKALRAGPQPRQKDAGQMGGFLS